MIDVIPNRKAIRGRLEIHSEDSRAQLYHRTIHTHTDIPVCVVLRSDDGIVFRNHGIYLDMSRLRNWQMQNLVSELASRVERTIEDMWYILFSGSLNIDQRNTNITFLQEDFVLSCQWPPTASITHKREYSSWQNFENC